MSPPIEHVESVSQSYARVRGTGFAERFYERLLRADEDIRRTFARTDLERQRELFLHGLFALIDFARGRATGTLAIRRLAAVHGPGELDVSARLYDVWLETLIATLREKDPSWSSALESAWIEVIEPGVTAIREAAAIPPNSVDREGAPPRR